MYADLLALDGDGNILTLSGSLSPHRTEINHVPDNQHDNYHEHHDSPAIGWLDIVAKTLQTPSQRWAFFIGLTHFPEFNQGQIP